jgi:hypothetical protein
MAKKTHHKKHKEGASKDYEAWQYGPLTLERSGRFLSMRSDWGDGDQFESHMKRIREGRPKHKDGINQKIQEMLSLAPKVDPLELLASIAVQNAFADPEEYKEATHEGKECFIEYAQGLLLGLNEESYSFGKSNEAAMERFITLIADIHNDVLWYFGSEAAEGKANIDDERIRFESFGHFLYVRGDSYPEHHSDLVVGLFEPHNTFLVNHYGFTTTQILAGVKEIEDQVAEQVNRHFEFLGKLHHLHGLFKEFVDKKDVEAFACEEELKRQYQELPEVQAESAKLATLQEGLKPNPFKLTANDKIPVTLLDLLSARFGENEPFLSFHKSPGWPTNDSVVFEKPLILYSGDYYCFGAQILFRNIGNILEGWIEKADLDYFKNTYQERRGAFLEQKAIEYFSHMLPAAQAYAKLYYKGIENGKPKRCETDGIILYDTHLFIIEAKAGSLSLSARRGGLERTMSDLGKLVDGAYIQAKRTLEYINANKTPTFEDENGTPVLTIADKRLIKHTYLINVTLANLSHLATHLSSLKPFNLIQGRDWPWSVFINDLRIISEIVESPSVFLHFLQRRIGANDFPQFHAADELDFFMFYLHDGLYLETKFFRKVDSFVPGGYTENLDRYYDFIAGRVSSGDKPQLKMSSEYKRIIFKIEDTQKPGFTEATTRLLDFDHKTQRTILRGIENAKVKSAKDGRDYDLTMYFDHLSFGLMISVGTSRKDSFWRDIDEHCHLKLYQTKLEEWLLIAIDIGEGGVETFDFRLYRKKWEFDEQMEPKLKRFKEWKMNKFADSGQKPERNKPCPCGSGFKYKKCCER